MPPIVICMVPPTAGSYCVEGTASLNYASYGDTDNPIQSKKQDPLDLVHVGERVA